MNSIGYNAPMPNNNYGYNYNPMVNNYNMQQQQQAMARLQQLEAQQNMYNQPQMQPQSQPAQTPQFDMVNGVKGASAYVLTPNSSIILLDTQEDYLYMKSCDANGNASLRVFKYEEVIDNSNSQPNDIDLSKFATQDELYELRDKIEQLSKELGINEKPKEEPKKANKKGGE